MKTSSVTKTQTITTIALNDRDIKKAFGLPGTAKIQYQKSAYSLLDIDTETPVVVTITYEEESHDS